MGAMEPVKQGAIFFPLHRPLQGAIVCHMNPGLRCACPGLFHVAPLALTSQATKANGRRNPGGRG